MKEFLKSPRKTAILGLIGSLIMTITIFATYETHALIYNFCNLYIFGLIVYFIIILERIYCQRGNLKVTNFLLVGTYIISLCVTIFEDITEGESIIIDTLIFGIIILYFCNILFRKLKFINNKVFAITVIGVSMYQIINICRYSFEYNESNLYTILYLIRNLAYMTIIPYFYNYYNLLKEENKNGK